MNVDLFVHMKGYRLRIESLRIVDGALNYELFFHSFYIFDAILSVVDIGYDISVKSSDIEILETFINNELIIYI